ncbi:IS1634 family transposase [Buchananella felis]
MRTSSGAVAVQIMTKEHGRQVVLAHVGSAHNEAELAVLVRLAHERMHAGQAELDLDGVCTPERQGTSLAAPVVKGQASRLLWGVLEQAWYRLGFSVVDDEAFRQLVLARLVEPASKVETIRILEELGIAAPHRSTIKRALKRCQERNYRSKIAKACYKHALARGTLALCLYDVTTLYFEAPKEDELRKVGYSKERRVDPQVLVGLLVDSTGFPLQIGCFEGNRAETRTLLPVLQEMRALHGVKDLVVVADAGMLCAANLDALEEAGYGFIVGSRIAKAPHDLADHFHSHGTFMTDGQIVETTTRMGSKTRRVVYQYSRKRFVRDNTTITAQENRARAILAGQTRPKTARFLKKTGTQTRLDEAAIQKARDLAGLKGYVTNIPTTVLDGAGVINQYHQLWHVEQSFRMAKTDLSARPMFHHVRESIEAHLTIVYTALAIARHLQAVTGVSIKKIVRTLRPLREVTIEIAGHEVTAKPDPGPDAHAILNHLPGY